MNCLRIEFIRRRLSAPRRRMRPAVTPLLLLILTIASSARATLVPRMTMERMIGDAQVVIHGKVSRTWAGWDNSRQFIWTHYEIQTLELLKGGAPGKVVVSEPGGMVGQMSMQVVGAPRYRVGNEVILFLTRTPIGYLRTAGWGQGKFTVSGGESAAEKIVRAALPGVTLVDLPRKPGVQPRYAGTNPGALDGLALTEFKARLKLLTRAQPQGEIR